MNKQILLNARPAGFPKETDFRIVETAIPEPGDGQFLVGLSYLSVDPYMRMAMNEQRAYGSPLQLGDVMLGGGVGRVLKSKHPLFKEGEYVVGYFGWQQYALSDGSGDTRKVDPSLAPISTSLGILGMPGLTAYFGFVDITKPKAGETVVVSGAAGAVGSYVGQLAKVHGCRVIGIAGSDDKIAWLKDELGFDGAFNYKTTPDYRAALGELCPKGIDIYFDNVGGRITDDVFTLLNNFARVSVCGQISLYNAQKPEPGPRLLPLILARQATVRGFLVFQFMSRYGEGLEYLAGLLREGRLKYRENIIEGIGNAPKAFLGLLRGENTGKQLVKISEL